MSDSRPLTGFDFFAMSVRAAHVFDGLRRSAGSTAEALRLAARALRNLRRPSRGLRRHTRRQKQAGRA